MFNDSDPKLERKNVDPDTLFSDEALFKKESIFDDVTPSTLVPPNEATPSIVSRLLPIPTILPPIAFSIRQSC